VSRFIGLSSIAQNMHDVGERAADRLLSRINIGSMPDEFVSELITPELVVRKSSQESR